MLLVQPADSAEPSVSKAAVPQHVLLNEAVLRPVEASEAAWVELVNADKHVSYDVTGYCLQLMPRVWPQERGQWCLPPPSSSSSEAGHWLLSPGQRVVIPLSSFDLGPDAGQLLLLTPDGETTLDVLPYASQAQAEAHGDARVHYRVPDGGLWAQDLGRASTPGAANDGRMQQPAASIGPWQPGRFEIHTFDIGQGDAQLIVFPSGYSILIDVSERSWNSRSGARDIAAKIRHVLGGSSSVDVGVISHLHLDHMGYAGYGGFWGLVYEEGIHFGKLVDRDSGTWSDANGDGACSEEEIEWHVVGTFSGTAVKWLCDATRPGTQLHGLREVAQLCSTSQIQPPDADSWVQIVTTDGIGAVMPDGSPVNADHSRDALPPSENGLSIGLWVHHGSFDYVTMGDLDGEDAVSASGYVYTDVEGAIVQRLMEVDVYHVNHHGSSHSSSAPMMQVLRPTVSVCSCGADNSYGHPDQGVMDRLLSYGQLYTTTNCDPTRNYGSAERVNGDVVIVSSDGGQSYTVHGIASTTYTAKAKVDKRRCP